MDGWNGWLTPDDKNDGRKGGGIGDRIGFGCLEDWTGLGGIRLSERVFKIFKMALRKK